jgi:hypothetical protein
MSVQIALAASYIKEELCYFPIGGFDTSSKMECTFPFQLKPDGPLKFYTMKQDELHALAAMSLFNPRLAHSIVGRVPPPSTLGEKFVPISIAVTD